MKHLKNNVVKFQIFYDYLGYINIEESIKMSDFDFIANIGNFYGLYLGMSFLSFFELFELAYSVLLILIKCDK